MYLTLPLPMHKKWKHEVYYIPWDLAKPHAKVKVTALPCRVLLMRSLQVPVEISRDASFKDLRHLLGRWLGAQPDNVGFLYFY
jgi:ubiquitin carboxyl-terminal hydrolase 4/11/15